MALPMSPDTSPPLSFQLLSSRPLLGSASVSLSVPQPGDPCFQQVDGISNEDSWEVEMSSMTQDMKLGRPSEA